MSCIHDIPNPDWCALCRRQKESPVTIDLPTILARYRSCCPGCGDDIDEGKNIYRLPDDGVRAAGSDEPLELQGAWVCRECAIQHVELAHVGEADK